MAKVSVVIRIYNAEPYVDESITSILNQSFADFELIVVNDGSTDDSETRILRFEDPRITYLAFPENRGVAAATVAGVAVAKGSYIALFDADDIAMPHRLETQVRLLNGQPRLTIVGGQMQCFGESNAMAKVPPDDATIKANLLAGVGNICNPTAMIQRDFIEKHALQWEASHRSGEDWGFFVDAMRCGAKFANTADVLVRYRIHAAQISKDPSANRPVLASIRTKVMKLLFPGLTAEECMVLEPLLQWVCPPPMPLQDLEAGLALIPRTMAHKQSVYGENRRAVNQFLGACENRWRHALSQTASQDAVG